MTFSTVNRREILSRRDRVSVNCNKLTATNVNKLTGKDLYPDFVVVQFHVVKLKPLVCDRGDF